MKVGRLWVPCLLLSVLTPWASAQEPNDIDQLRRVYNDALEQLKAAQDRKTELATENEKLTEKLQAAESQLAELSARIEGLREESRQLAESSLLWRSHQASWNEFLRYFPDTRKRYDLFLDQSLLTPFTTPPSTDWYDVNWPFSSAPDRPRGST